MADRTKAIEEAVSFITGKRNLGEKELLELKKHLSLRYGLSELLRNSEIYEKIPEAKRTRRLTRLLRIRPVRSFSGVSVVAVMTPPSKCPGSCIYCPGGSDSPKSYTGFEPAARRAKQNEFDPFKQVSARLRQLESIGHSPEKCELIVMGGTFNALPRHFQQDFVKHALDAFNGIESRNLEQSKKLNECAAHRVVGICFETRPDFASEKQVSSLLELGATRLELGVQTLSDEVYQRVGRGHTKKEVIEATRVCKDALLKVGYHYMPGLFVERKRDVRMFRELFENPAFRPDMLKIYPCLVVPGTKLFTMWKRGEYSPYEAEDAAEVIAEMKRFIPPYCRVMRVDRDIPTDLIAAGVRKSNLRQLVKQRMEEKGTKCRCIRCREIGLRTLKENLKIDWNALELKRRDYEASGGKEVFLSFEDEENDALIGFLRLRKPSEKIFRKEITENSLGIRELHVYGEQVGIGKKEITAAQHKSFGKKLVEEAERISRGEFGAEKLLVISGVGVKPYYRKLGFRDDGVYLSKKL
ncbi:tRNA uridine(34) 5-carboxymethylaminomethyl modification radical SAM/GNAT enzyme Elp3 [Candidatus Micrarchaeota archaeon]|nr:tRNA uridine(34) 5-carboxymethylaminomethyl modification radical SAM/GNAT enzyme Elp3 [Candidatus Micrarchaeota archaeon]